MSKKVRAKKKIAFNPIEGEFDLVADNNFSYESVPENKKLLIDDNMQMIITEQFEVEGELFLYGSLVIED